MRSSFPLKLKSSFTLNSTSRCHHVVNTCMLSHVSHAPASLFPPLPTWQLHFASSQGDYHPRPADLRAVNLTRTMLEMAERVAENSHESWARSKRYQLDDLGSSDVTHMPLRTK